MTDFAEDGSDAGIVAAVAAVVARPGRTTLALPGGATPGPIFAGLAALPLAWDTVTIIPGDERCVPADHPASNLGQLRRAFGATGATVVPLREGPAPAIDLIWLGMGTDGHIASLFPNTDPDPAASPAVIRVRPDPMPPEAPFDRLTPTLAAIAAVPHIILVVRGVAKRALLDAAAAGANDLPVARLLRIAPVTVYWSAT